MVQDKDKKLLQLYVQIRQSRRYIPQEGNSEEQTLLGELEEMCLIQRRRDGRYETESCTPQTDKLNQLADLMQQGVNLIQEARNLAEDYPQ